MKLFKDAPAILVTALLVGGGVTIVWKMVAPTDRSADVAMAVPVLSPPAVEGKRAFDANCAECHGENGTGTDKGPPLVHDIYNPGHHGDNSFLAAARQGIAQHHWRFGNMPPQPQVKDEQMAVIVQYIRELQQANGIFYRAHNM
jgi:mono/diheme cytochrome c family protein